MPICKTGKPPSGNNRPVVIINSWTAAFAFDTKRKAVLLVAGDESGGGKKRFYRGLIRKADELFDAHPAGLKKGGRWRSGKARTSLLERPQGSIITTTLRVRPGTVHAVKRALRIAVCRFPVDSPDSAPRCWPRTPTRTSVSW